MELLDNQQIRWHPPLMLLFENLASMSLLRQRVFIATESPQVHPRTRKITTKIGIGTPKAQSKIHPIFPFSVLSIVHLIKI
jgi:hypothetical protein